jgi:hypothetical protein
MKQSLILAIIYLSALTASSAQDITVPATQRTLISKRTASWCSLCGGWGWTFFRNLIDDNADKAVLLGVQYDGQHTTPTSLALAANFGGVSQPIFFVNNVNQQVTSSTAASARTAIANQVNTAYAAQPVAQTGLKLIFDNSTQMLTVQSKTRFFQASSGEYYLGLYVVQKSFIGFQAGQGSSAQHKERLFTHLGSTPFGEWLASGAIAAGTEYSGSAQINLSGQQVSNLRIVSILWKKEGNTYRVVNTNDEDNFLSPSNQRESVFSEVSIKAFPNLLSADATLYITTELEQPLESTIWLTNLTGRKVSNLFQGLLTSGSLQFRVNSFGLTPGVYLLVVSAGQERKAIKLILTE